MGTSVIPAQKITAAAAGNQALQEMLQSITTTVNQQQAITGTSGRNTPPQAKATVTYQSGQYIVEIQNPGTASQVSVLQAAQNAAAATAISSVQPVTAIFHQVRCATSPRFSLVDGVQTFGGDSGSTQTIWNIPGVGAGTNYFQVRSSYDGVNFNLWRNTNGGVGVGVAAGGVTQTPASNCLWATFTLPGSQLVGFGAGQADDNDTFGVPSGLLSGSMCAIPGQNGFNHSADNVSHGVDTNAIVLDVPLGGTVTTTTGFTPRVQQTYQDGEGNVWTGAASIFAFAVNPYGANQSVYPVSGGQWTVMVLPGGALLAIGGGVISDGGSLPLPSELSWVEATNTIGIVSPNHAYSDSHQARGYGLCSLAGLTVHATFRDGSGNTWGGTANWFAVACSSGYPLHAVGAGKFFVLKISESTEVCIGAGYVASETPITLPDGFTSDLLLTFATPRDAGGDGSPESGVKVCAFNGLAPQVTYEDSTGSLWGGNVNWMVFGWQ